MADNNKRQPLLGIQRSRRAADDFLRAGRRKENRGSDGFDLHNRFSQMSDEEFDKGVADGTITPEQIRKAGQYAYDNYLLDVWSEMDRAETEPEPTYEQFMENPYKYGYSEREEYPDRLYRYNPRNRYEGSTDSDVEGVPRRLAEGVNPAATAPADNTAVAKKPVPQK